MKLFVLITLALLFMGLTHLINWIWRLISDGDDEIIVVGIIATIIYLLAIYYVLHAMFLWCPNVIL